MVQMKEMIRTVAVVLAASCFAAACAPPVRGAALAMPDDIRATLNAYVAAHPYAVLVAGVVDADGTNSYVAVGKNAPVRQANERTQFQIGSVTKTFTATLLAQMVLAHEVSLDDPIQRYLPPGVTAPTYQGTPITLLTLAEQRSGLPRLPGNFTPHDPTNPYAAYTVGDLDDAVRETKPTRVPGSEYEHRTSASRCSDSSLANREHTSYASPSNRASCGRWT